MRTVGMYALRVGFDSAIKLAFEGVRLSLTPVCLPTANSTRKRG